MDKRLIQNSANAAMALNFFKGPDVLRNAYLASVALQSLLNNNPSLAALVSRAGFGTAHQGKLPLNMQWYDKKPVGQSIQGAQLPENLPAGHTPFFGTSPSAYRGDRLYNQDPVQEQRVQRAYEYANHLANNDVSYSPQFIPYLSEVGLDDWQRDDKSGLWHTKDAMDVDPKKGIYRTQGHGFEQGAPVQRQMLNDNDMGTLAMLGGVLPKHIETPSGLEQRTVAKNRLNLGPGVPSHEISVGIPNVISLNGRAKPANRGYYKKDDKTIGIELRGAVPLPNNQWIAPNSQTQSGTAIPTMRLSSTAQSDQQGRSYTTQQFANAIAPIDHAAYKQMADTLMSGDDREIGALPTTLKKQFPDYFEKPL